MSGHSKWATIHRKKGILDQQRAKVFQKISKEIMVAAKGTNGDINTNSSLRQVVEKAKTMNMPKDNIENAITKAISKNNIDNFEVNVYEAYLKGGVAMLIYSLTDNKNRTSANIKAILNKYEISLASSGAVAYQFMRCAELVFLKKFINEETFMNFVIELEVLDTKEDEENYIVYTSIDKFINTKDKFTEAGVEEFVVSEITSVPENTIVVDEEAREANEKIIELLEELDDVQDVYTNMEN